MAQDQPTKGQRVKALEARLGIRDAGAIRRRREAEKAREGNPNQMAARRLRSTQRWQDLRLEKLKANPLCQICERKRLVVAALEVDHVIPLVDRMDLGFEWENLMSVCRPCHNRKTAREAIARRRAVERTHAEDRPRT